MYSVQQLYQPRGSNLCGQTCLAMLAKTSVEAVYQILPKPSGINMLDMICGLQYYGFPILLAETGLRPNHPLPNNAMMGMGWWEVEQSHWLLRINRQVYNPTETPLGMRTRPGGWIHKYIEFSLDRDNQQHPVSYWLNAAREHAKKK